MGKAQVKEREPALFSDGETTKPAAPKVQPKKNAVAKVVVKATNLPAKTDQPVNLLVALSNAIADPRLEPAKVHAMIDARDRLMKQEAHVAFVAAYIDMQEELPVIDARGRIIIEKPGSRKQETPFAYYKEIQKVTKPILRKHKFAMMMLPDIGPNGVGVVMRGQLAYVCDTQYGRMVHVEQCAIGAPLETSGSKNNVQGVGSSLSYTKRYAAIALLDLVSEAAADQDDDGEAAAAGKKRNLRPAAGAAAEPGTSTVPADEKINGSQAKELLKVIDECGVEATVFMDKYKITAVHDLPAAMFDEAVKNCRDYLARTKASKARRG